MPVQTAQPTLPSDDKRWRAINGTMRRYGYSRNALIETLHTVQQSFGYLDDEALKYVAQSLRVPLSQAYGVATFYHFFSLTPPGKHTCVICTGTACFINGAAQLLARAEKCLDVKSGRTTPDGNVSLLQARCLGPCSLAPVAVWDEEVSANATEKEVQERLEGWVSHAS